MSKSKKIINNPTIADLQHQMQAFEMLESIYNGIPFASKLFPQFKKPFADFSKIKEQAEILKIPDRFNECFSSLGWIAYESMNMEVMKKAISVYESQGEPVAEVYLAESYDEECLKWGIRWFNGNSEFRRRIRLAELAKTDYLAGRYHACIPLLLSLLDGLVNDVSKHVGFFAGSADLTAWDCIAAHETGLQSLVSLMTKGRNKTNEETTFIPYRHGILHGRELAFDNRIVAAKSWGALFAARDWAVAVSDGKKIPKPKKEIAWKELLNQISENDKQKKLLDAWKARATEELAHLPHDGSPEKLPVGTPERTVAEFLENWRLRRYGILAELLLDYIGMPKGKKAGIAKEDFGKKVPLSFKILAIEDQAPAISHVIAELEFQNNEKQALKQASIRTVYVDGENNPMVRNSENGQWRVIQGSFIEILHAKDS
jgi:hypothetical protein